MDWEGLLRTERETAHRSGQASIGSILVWFREWSGQTEVGGVLVPPRRGVALIRVELQAMRDLLRGVAVMAGRLAPGCQVAQPEPTRERDGSISAKVRVVGSVEEREAFDAALRHLVGWQ